MEQIGGSPRVRDDLYHALEAGQKVTAKVQWLSKSSHNGRSRWIHCTPLISANGLIGVWMVILVDDDEGPPAAAASAAPEPLPSKTGSTDVAAPTPWESPKTNHSQRQENRSPSTANSSQTAFSDPAKPAVDKVPSPVIEDPETVSLPFAAPKPRSLTAAISVTEIKPDDQVTGMDWVEPDHPRQSANSMIWSRPQQSRNRYEQQPDIQPLHVRPGPRIAGKVYSFNSSSENGISADDEPRSSHSRGGSDPPTSPASNLTASRTNVQPHDFRWRKMEEHLDRLPSRAGPVPIKLPGRASQDSDVVRPAVWKTKKKSLSPYGFLFDDH